MRPILLFDIDGTLLQVEYKFMRQQLSDILKTMSLDTTILQNTSFAGRTDQSIFRSLLGDRHRNDHLYEELKGNYITQMLEHMIPEHLSVFEHVQKCLTYFTERNYHLGLLTGNFKEIAAHKLELAGLQHYFSFGAYGCDHTDRNMLGRAAQNTFRKKYRNEAESEDFLIIGDTPLDIKCAKYFGCRCVVVTTGRYSKEELARLNPDLILESLESPKEWVREF